MKKLEKYLPLLVLIAFLPILIFRDFSISNELRYLSIADEALRNGNLFTFTNNGLPYADKPPLYLWIVMLGKLVFGTHYMWFIGLFSLVPALIILRVMRDWIVADCTLPEKEWRLTSQLMLITCGMFLGLNVFLRMDTLMCLFIILALRTFYRMYQGRGDFRKQSWIFGLWVFLAIFTKGPVGILMPLLCPLVFLLFKREGRSFFHYWNFRVWLVLLVLCGLWFGAAYLEGGTEYLDNLLFHQTRDRAVNAFHHKKPFYYYLVQIWPSLAPYSLLLVGVWIAAMLRHRFTSDTEYFWSTVVLTTLVMLSAVSGKLSVYLAPIIPFLVFLCVSLLRKFQRSPWIQATLALPALTYVAALPVLVYAANCPELTHLGQVAFYIAAGILSAAGVWTLCVLYNRRNHKQQGVRKAVNTMGFSLLLAAFAGGWALPAVNPYIGYRDVCEKAVEVRVLKDLGHYHSLYLRRAENMDVFLGESIHQIAANDSLTDITAEVKALQNTVLLLREKKFERKAEPGLKEYLSGKESYVVGPYRIVAL
ncbi:MAG: dolichyl-phosphate-mannose--protein mannosyltransferase [Bacteroides sp.]|nr:dolichyl-phosphate-mannose--protein mannosyltransferase [Bacteroides sp.]